MDAYKDAIMAHAVYYPVVEFLSAVAIACVIWFGGNDVIHHTVVTRGILITFSQHRLHWQIVPSLTTLGVLVAFIQYAQRFFRPIQDFSEKYNILQSAMASSERVFKLLDTPTEVVAPTAPKKADGPGRIEFNHVWFAYRTVPDDHVVTGTPARQAEQSSAVPREPQPDWVLRDVSFTIEPGQTVAIVGHTGAGKTTIISLLMRFYDVQKGAITVDGVDIKEMDLADLRRRFGVVLQDPFLFTGTIETNIRLGTDWISDADVEKPPTM